VGFFESVVVVGVAVFFLSFSAGVRVFVLARVAGLQETGAVGRRCGRYWVLRHRGLRRGYTSPFMYGGEEVGEVNCLIQRAWARALLGVCPPLSLCPLPRP